MPLVVQGVHCGGGYLLNCPAQEIVYVQGALQSVLALQTIVRSHVMFAGLIHSTCPHHHHHCAHDPYVMSTCATCLNLAYPSKVASG